MSDTDVPPDGLPTRQRIPAVVAVLLCIVAASINITLINLALPVLATELHVGAEQIIYVVSGYQLTMVLFLLVLSHLGDFFGFKRVFLAGAIVFSASALGCAISPSLPVLVFFRVVQGLGATAIQGSYFSLLTLIYPKRQLGRGIGLCSMTFALATLAGPPLAALILAVGSWHWLFIISLPLGIVAGILGWRYFPANVVTVTKCPVNAIDVVLHVIVFGLFFFAASGWSHHPQQWVGNALLSALCICAAFVYVLKQRGQQTPFFPIDLLRQGSFGFPILLAVLSFAALLTSVVAAPFIFHNRFEYTTPQIGFFLTALTGGVILSSMVAGYTIEKVKPIYLCGVGFAILASIAFSLAVLPEKVTAYDLIWRLILFGIGSGLIQPANNFLAICAAPPHRKGAANGILATSMMFGQILGMVLVTAVFSTTGSEATLAPFCLSGIIAIIGLGVVFARLRY